MKKNTKKFNVTSRVNGWNFCSELSELGEWIATGELSTKNLADLESLPEGDTLTVSIPHFDNLRANVHFTRIN